MRKMLLELDLDGLDFYGPEIKSKKDYILLAIRAYVNSRYEKGMPTSKQFVYFSLIQKIESAEPLTKDDYVLLESAEYEMIDDCVRMGHPSPLLVKLINRFVLMFRDCKDVKIQENKG